jgi:REP element-mobilizing transposase RayT
MKFDPQRHHRRSIRLHGYDYSQAGAYYVTIVAQGRACLFGEIVNGQMRLNAAGRIVQWEWQRLGQRFPNVQLDAFIVMPNHIHGIILIRADGVGAKQLGQVGATRPGQTECISGEDIMPDEKPVGNDGSPLREDTVPDEASVGNDGSPVPNGPVPGSLGAMIGQFKSRVTKRLWAKPGLSGIPVWQRNYYEHIIRNENERIRIRGYIESNPVNWDDDDENLLKLA